MNKGGISMGKRLLAAALAMLWLLPGKMAWADGEADLELAGAKAAVLMEQGSGQVVYGVQGDEKLEVGGLSRLPGAIGGMRRDRRRPIGIGYDGDHKPCGGGHPWPNCFFIPRGGHRCGVPAQGRHHDYRRGRIYALGEAVFGTEEACLTRIQERLLGLNIQAEYRDIMGTGSSYRRRIWPP